MTPEYKPQQTESSTTGERPGGRVIDSDALLGGRSELLIRHEGRIYRLRRTRLGKLILTA